MRGLGESPGIWVLSRELGQAQPRGRSRLRWGERLSTPWTGSGLPAQACSGIGLPSLLPRGTGGTAAPGLGSGGGGYEETLPQGELVPGNLMSTPPPPALPQTPISCAPLPPRPSAMWACPPAWSTRPHLQPTCQAPRRPRRPHRTTPSCSGTCT